MLTRIFLAAVIVVAAWAESSLQPVKGFINVGPIDPNSKDQSRSAVVTLRLYDQEFGGKLLFEERQTVVVDGNGMFVAQLGAATRSGLPTRLTDQYATMWAEYASGSGWVSANASGRQQMTVRKELTSNVVVSIPTSTTMCFTCGGSWPIFQGAWNVVSATNNVSERGSLCAGTPILRTDSRPFLCARD